MKKQTPCGRALSLACLLGLMILPSIRTQAGTAPSRPILERIEWTDIWVTNADQDNLPRVLFVGDSITRGYFSKAEKELEGVANCARYATSAFISHQDFLDGLKIMLRRYDFAVIHINNGLHGWGYTEAQYRDGFPALIKLLKEYAPNATLIWATTTPVRRHDHVQQLKEESTRRVRERNRIALAAVKPRGFLISDLYTLVIDHPEYYQGDGVHYNGQGTAVQAKYVAGIVRKALAARKSAPKK